MKYNDINQLRNGGRIVEALDAAREKYNECVDHRSASELFWCLRAYFYSISSIDQKREIAAQMHEVALDTPSPNEYISNTLKRIDREILPKKSVMNDAERLVKDGKAPEAYQMLLSCYEKKEMSKEQYESFGWVIYRALNHYKTSKLSERQMLFDNYYSLNLKTPSMLHSCILSEAIKTKKDNPYNFNFIGFAEDWGLNNLREEDWQGTKSADGRRYPSLVERMIKRYMDEIKTDSSLIPTKGFIEVLSKACRKWSRNGELQGYKAISINRIDR